MPLFRDLLGGERRDLGIDTLTAPEPGGVADSDPENIFASIGVDRVEAARKTLGYLNSGGAEPPFITLGRSFTVDRAHGYRDYKFTEAAFENTAAMGSPWRERYLAASTLYLNGPVDRPNEVAARAAAGVTALSRRAVYVPTPNQRSPRSGAAVACLISSARSGASQLAQSRRSSGTSRLETRGVWCIAERDGLFQEGCQGYRSRDAAQSGSANSNPGPTGTRAWGGSLYRRARRRQRVRALLPGRT